MLNIYVCEFFTIYLYDSFKLCLNYFNEFPYQMEVASNSSSLSTKMNIFIGGFALMLRNM